MCLCVKSLAIARVGCTLPVPPKTSHSIKKDNRKVSLVPAGSFYGCPKTDGTRLCVTMCFLYWLLPLVEQTLVLGEELQTGVMRVHHHGSSSFVVHSLSSCSIQSLCWAWEVPGSLSPRTSFIWQIQLLSFLHIWNPFLKRQMVKCFLGCWQFLFSSTRLRVKKPDYTMDPLVSELTNLSALVPESRKWRESLPCLPLEAVVKITWDGMEQDFGNPKWSQSVSCWNCLHTHGITNLRCHEEGPFLWFSYSNST
jgi:hypothetical protein